MAQYTVEQIGEAAAGACFYITPLGECLRIQNTDKEGGTFCAVNENSGEEYDFTFEEVAEDESPHFEKLTRVVI